MGESEAEPGFGNVLAVCDVTGQDVTFFAYGGEIRPPSTGPAAVSSDPRMRELIDGQAFLLDGVQRLLVGVELARRDVAELRRDVQPCRRCQARRGPASHYRAGAARSRA